MKVGWSSLALSLVVGLVPSTAVAQYSAPLFVEIARDPGRADTPTSARSVALGGTKAASGRQEDALGNPAGLALLPRRSAIGGSLGQTSFGRQELVLTPGVFPVSLAARALKASPGSGVHQVSAAYRRGPWAAGGFLDATDRMRHAFETGYATLRTTAHSGSIYTAAGSGAASFDRRVLRVGGSVARTLGTPRAAVGAGVYLARVTAEVASEVAVDSRSIIRLPPLPVTDTTTRSTGRNAVSVDSTGLGVVASVLVKPTDGLVLGARWQRDPAAAGVRRATESLMQSSTHEVELRLPWVAAGSMTLSRAATTVVFETSWTAYNSVLGHPVDALAPNTTCSLAMTTNCPRWGLDHFELRNSLGLRTGAEHAVPMGRRTILLRGGAAFDQAYTLSMRAESWANAALGSATVAPEPTPERRHRWYWSAGGAYALGSVEVGAGCMFGSERDRCVTDLSLRF